MDRVRADALPQQRTLQQLEAPLLLVPEPAPQRLRQQGRRRCRRHCGDAYGWMETGNYVGLVH